MSTSGSTTVEDVVTRLSKELELMGLPGLASRDGHDVDVIGLINASYDLIGLIRDLQRFKRQREDHAQQLIHDLQRSQWLLDKERELSVQREREAAEACEKERQANVRLQLAETLLKKKTEEHRQLLHECQLKENQWVHATRRRDQDNHRLHQQLLKFLRAKPTAAVAGGNKGTVVPLEVEIRGSLAPPRIAGASRSETPTRRKQWDDSRKLVEVKWKSSLNSLEKEHQLLRADYLQLVDMVGRFLSNCLAKTRIRRSATNPFDSNVAEWIQLPVCAMRDRLEDVFSLLEDNISMAGHSADGNENVKQSEQTAVVAGWDNCRTRTVNDWLNPIMKDDVTPLLPSCKSRQTSGTEKSIRSEEPTSDQGCSADGPSDPCAFLKPTEGNEPLPANQIDWNQVTQMDNNDSAVYTRQNTVIVRKSTSGTSSTSHATGETISDVDTPCPSRRASSSSSSSGSSCKSQGLIGIEDERFFQACTDAASLANNPRRPSATSTVSILNGGGSITAKVSFLQQRPATPSTADPIDLQCLVTTDTR